MLLVASRLLVLLLVLLLMLMLKLCIRKRNADKHVHCTKCIAASGLGRKGNRKSCSKWTLVRRTPHNRLAVAVSVAAELGCKLL